MQRTGWTDDWDRAGASEEPELRLQRHTLLNTETELDIVVLSVCTCFLHCRAAAAVITDLCIVKNTVLFCSICRVEVPHSILSGIVSDRTLMLVTGQLNGKSYISGLSNSQEMRRRWSNN